MANDPRCKETGKVIYLSKHSALQQQRTVTGKRMRIYPCEFHPGHLHATKSAPKKLHRN